MFLFPMTHFHSFFIPIRIYIYTFPFDIDLEYFVLNCPEKCYWLLTLCYIDRFIMYNYRIVRADR